jgi:periodic tryptophan protein 2
MIEEFAHTSDVLNIAFRSDGKEICTINLRGVISFFDPEEEDLKGTIDTIDDSYGGRLSTDVRSAKARKFSRIFHSISYNSDGSCVIAGGNSIYICIYHVLQKSLLKKFQVCSNLSFDGVLDKLHTRNVTIAGSYHLIEDIEEQENRVVEDLHEVDTKKKKLLKQPIPGVQSGPYAPRKKIIAKTYQVSFATTGRSWIACTSEGILLFSMDNSLIFDPFELDINITPQNLLSTLEEKEYLKSLVVNITIFLFCLYF